MPHPNFYSEGTAARIKDTRHRSWVKILSFFQNQPGAIPANNPRQKDTLRQLKTKVNKALTGTS